MFLAGSIEMGLAEDWQTTLVAELADVDGVALNPAIPLVASWAELVAGVRARL